MLNQPTNSAATVVTEFVLDRMGTLPVPERIRLTRAAAQLVPDENHRQALTQIADALERIERQQRRLILRVKGRGKL